MPYLNKHTTLYIAIIFHFVGLIGIFFTPYREWFIASTPSILILMFLLLINSQHKLVKKFLLFFLITFLVGMITEIIGVNTGFLFGHYQYGSVLGPKLFGVPIMIGFNWFIIVFSADSFLNQSIESIKNKYNFNCLKKYIPFILIVGGATITTCFDIILEPAAIKLKFWTWDNGVIPLFNYLCWFLISAFLLVIKLFFKINFINKFATSLFIIQVIFFLILSLFL